MTMQMVLIAAAVAFGGIAGSLLSRSALRRRAHQRSKKEAMRRGGVAGVGHRDAFACDGVAGKTLDLLVSLNERLSHGAAKPLLGWMPAPKAEAEQRLREMCMCAGFQGEVSFGAYREARVRLAIALALVGFVLGACLSNELMALLALVGLVAGAFLPRWAIRQEMSARDALLKRELPEMLEVVGLGISSGLSFDRSFSLYPSYFNTQLARDCAEAHRKWALGFVSREDALKDLARGYDSALLNRVVQNVIRSMRFGTQLSDDLVRAASDGRAEQKAARQEQIAKVPVRMMIPTACLILPAMLLLVLGPVLLELIAGF